MGYGGLSTIIIPPLLVCLEHTTMLLLSISSSIVNHTDRQVDSDI